MFGWSKLWVGQAAAAICWCDISSRLSDPNNSSPSSVMLPKACAYMRMLYFVESLIDDIPEVVLRGVADKANCWMGFPCEPREQLFSLEFQNNILLLIFQIYLNHWQVQKYLFAIFIGNWEFALMIAWDWTLPAVSAAETSQNVGMLLTRLSCVFQVGRRKWLENNFFTRRRFRGCDTLLRPEPAS